MFNNSGYQPCIATFIFLLLYTFVWSLLQLGSITLPVSPPPPALEMEGVELQFLPAVPLICFSLPLDSADDDLALELPETTPLRLSLPPGILAGDIATAAVVVVDDDCMSYSIHTLIVRMSYSIHWLYVCPIADMCSLVTTYPSLFIPQCQIGISTLKA